MSPTPSSSPLVLHNWRSVASSADGSTLVAVESPGGIWISVDSGESWTNNNKLFVLDFQSVTSSVDGSRLAVAVNQGDFGGPIYTAYKSDVYFYLWRSQGNVNNWASIASSANGSKLVAVADQLYTSVDFGETWTPRGCISPSWASVASSSDGVKLVAVEYDRIYTSGDSGVSWSQSSKKYGFLRAVASSSDGSTLIAAINSDDADQCGSILISTDSGANWTQQELDTFDVFSVASSANGSTLVAVSRKGRVNSVTGSIYVSVDTGRTWTSRPIYEDSYTDYTAVALSADGSKIVVTTYMGRIHISRDTGVTWKAVF